MKLILIRHAQSVRNALFKGNRFYRNDREKIGIPNHNLPISQKGEGQAKEAAKVLYSKFGRPDVILHSGFTRTLQTAKIIHNEMITRSELDGHTLTVELEQNHLLRERDAGYAFELTEAEKEKHFSYLDDYWKFEGNWFAVPPGGESFIQVMDRVSTFLHMLSLVEKYRDKTIYAVTHGGTMRAFQMLAEKVPFDKADELIINAKNCEIHAYQFNRGIWEKDVI